MPEIPRPWIIKKINEEDRRRSNIDRPHAPSPMPPGEFNDIDQPRRTEIDQGMPGIDRPEINDVDDDEKDTEIIDEDRIPTQEVPRNPGREPMEDIYKRKDPNGDRGIINIDDDDTNETEIVDSRIK